MAAYGIRGGEHDRARFGKRECKERGWDVGNDIGVVWICVDDYCDDWAFGDDTKYQSVGSTDGWGLMSEWALGERREKRLWLDPWTMNAFSAIASGLVGKGKGRHSHIPFFKANVYSDLFVSRGGIFRGLGLFRLIFSKIENSQRRHERCNGIIAHVEFEIFFVHKRLVGRESQA